jgi:Transposase DDE domain
VPGWSAPKRGTPRRQPIYSDLAIDLVLTLCLAFHLALRQAEAFAGSVLRLLGLALSVPDHSDG